MSESSTSIETVGISVSELGALETSIFVENVSTLRLLLLLLGVPP
jgi:hypothetical protein